MLNRWRRAARHDDGYSLTELLISMMVFGILMSITFAVMIQLTTTTTQTVARTDTIQQARLGIAQIDRQVRSGNVILNPEDEKEIWSGVDPYFSMRILTHAENEVRCAQWRVIDLEGDGFGDLQFRTWDPLYDTVVDVTPWGVVARNLIRIDTDPKGPADIDPADPLTWPPFWVDDTAGGDTQAQFVRITLRLKDPQERADAKPTSVTTVVTGRNTVFGYPTDSCTKAPPP